MLEGLLCGETVSESAERLGRSPRTVDRARSSVRVRARELLSPDATAEVHRALPLSNPASSLAALWTETSDRIARSRHLTSLVRVTARAATNTKGTPICRIESQSFSPDKHCGPCAILATALARPSLRSWTIRLRPRRIASEYDSMRAKLETGKEAHSPYLR